MTGFPDTVEEGYRIRLRGSDKVTFLVMMMYMHSHVLNIIMSSLFQISKTAVDIPYEEPAYSSKEHISVYPPRILLEITATKQCKELKCPVQLVGTVEGCLCTFNLTSPCPLLKPPSTEFPQGNTIQK